jgi:hypothetical protein
MCPPQEQERSAKRERVIVQADQAVAKAEREHAWPSRVVEAYPRGTFAPSPERVRAARDAYGKPPTGALHSSTDSGGKLWAAGQSATAGTHGVAGLGDDSAGGGFDCEEGADWQSDGPAEAAGVDAQQLGAAAGDGAACQEVLGGSEGVAAVGSSSRRSTDSLLNATYD